MSACSILFVYGMFLHEPPILRMLTLTATTFTAMKVMVTIKAYQNRRFPLSFQQWVGFAAGWAGMRAQAFETMGASALQGAHPRIRSGLISVVSGFALIYLAHKLTQIQIHANALFIIVSLLLLVAFSLILHFGVLSISAGLWRIAGARTYSLFKGPLTATSLNEFWSERWNLAFIEMTAILIFRPLKKTQKKTAALILAFAFSGLLHELAISVPVNSGYGLPFLYFMIQGMAVRLEQILQIRKAALFENKLLARLWMLSWLTAPLPLLFHAPFLREIIWPLAGL